MSRILTRRSSPPMIVQAVVAIIVGVGMLLALTGADSNTLHVCSVFLLLGFVVVGLEGRVAPLGLAALVVAWFLGVCAARCLPDLVNPNPSVARAVGGAAFFDTPFEAPEIGAVLSVAIPAVIALAAIAPATLKRLRAPASTEASSAGTPRAATPPATNPATTDPAADGRRPGMPWARAPAVVWIGTAIIAFTLVPDLRGYIHGYTGVLTYTWDTSNLETWQALVSQGLTPMKDFFYPYGYQYLFTLRSFGPAFQWLEQIACLAIAAWALWRLTGERAWRVLGCVLIVVLVGGWAAETWRYLPSFLVPLSYAALGARRPARPGRGHIVFFAACLLAALVEADLLLLGLVGIVLVVVGDLVAGELDWDGGRLLARWAVDAVPFVAAAVVLLVLWAITGTVTGNLRFFLDFSAVSASSAPDEQLYGPMGLLRVAPSTYSLYAAIPALLAVAGLLWARLDPARSAVVRSVLLGAAGVTMMMLLKHFVRPIGDLMLISAMIAIAWAVILTWRSGSLWRAAIGGAAVAATLSLFNETSAMTQYLTAAVSSPAHAVRSVGVVFNRAGRARSARAEFSAARFKGWPDQVIATYYSASVPHGTLPSFAIVGDSQMTYVLLHQRPPFQVDLYDAGRISEERNLVTQMRRRRPDYLIFRNDFNIDGINYAIRDPLVYGWMIRNYVPVQSFPTVDILHRRTDAQPIPVAFWTSRLGATEALQYIPSLSTATSAPRCLRGPDCVDYGVAHGTASPGATVTLQIAGRGRRYQVSFQTRRGVDAYPIRLDRLWFAPLVGPRPAVTSLTPGFTADALGLRTGGNLW